MRLMDHSCAPTKLHPATAYIVPLVLILCGMANLFGSPIRMKYICIYSSINTTAGTKRGNGSSLYSVPKGKRWNPKKKSKRRENVWTKSCRKIRKKRSHLNQAGVWPPLSSDSDCSNTVEHVILRSKSP